jgi:hypothetical protein
MKLISLKPGVLLCQPLSALYPPYSNSFYLFHLDCINFSLFRGDSTVSNEPLNPGSNTKDFVKVMFHEQLVELVFLSGSYS